MPVILLVLALAVLQSPRAAGHSASEPYFPQPDSQGGWRSVTSADAVRRVGGMDRARLDDAFEFTKGSSKNGGLLVVRRGWLVYERNFGKGHREATPNLASCGKSVTSIAVGILLAERPELFPDGLEQRIFTSRGGSHRRAPRRLETNCGQRHRPARDAATRYRECERVSTSLNVLLVIAAGERGVCLEVGNWT